MMGWRPFSLCKPCSLHRQPTPNNLRAERDGVPLQHSAQFLCSVQLEDVPPVDYSYVWKDTDAQLALRNWKVTQLVCIRTWIVQDRLTVIIQIDLMQLTYSDFNGHIVVHAMLVVKIDAIHTKPLQACLTCRAHVFRVTSYDSFALLVLADSEFCG